MQSSLDPPGPPGPPHQIPELEPAAAHRRSSADELLLVDVRERSEWDERHPAQAIHIPLGELDERLAELPPGAIAFICRSGMRSREAAAATLRAERSEVFNVTGGFLAWTLARLPTIPRLEV